MIRFNNDYNHGAFESILNALTATNNTSFAGYGEDVWCDRAETVIRKLIAKEDALIKFIPGATQANIVAISAALSPIQSVIAADTGHINCHEAASIENTGHKILELPNTNGKITAQQIAACAVAYYDGGTPEYLTEPKMVYLSFPTEQGTLYSKQELCDIREVCKKYGMYLFVDGARMGYGLGACIGAKVGRPDKICINIAGDGCFRMNMNELATLSRHNIPVIEVVVNNHVLGMVRQWQTLFYGKRYSNTVLQDQADFVKVAEALGVKGIRVTKKEEMGPAIREAIEGGKPALIDVWIDCDEKVFPMVPAGAPIEDVFDAEDLAKKEQEKD